MGIKKKWSAGEKIAIILDGLKGRPRREICRNTALVMFNITNGMTRHWKV